MESSNHAFALLDGGEGIMVAKLPGEEEVNVLL